MIDIVLATDDPRAVRDWLIDRGIVQIVDGNLIGVLGGFEYTAGQIPNPIVTDNTDPENPVYDTRKLYLMRLSAETEADQDTPDQGDEDQFDRAKIARWVKANGTPVTINSVNGWSIDGWLVNVGGTDLWLFKAPNRFGAFQ